MGGAGYTRLALREKTTSITPANIHFLENGFLPLATSRKVCDAWRKQSEPMDKRHSAGRWSTPGKRQVSVRKTWQRSSSTTNHLWHALKAVSAGSMLWSSLCWPAPSGSMRSNCLRPWRPPPSPTTGFEPNEKLATPGSLNPDAKIAVVTGFSQSEINEDRDAKAVRAQEFPRCNSVHPRKESQ